MCTWKSDFMPLTSGSLWHWYKWLAPNNITKYCVVFHAQWKALLHNLWKFQVGILPNSLAFTMKKGRRMYETKCIAGVSLHQIEKLYLLRHCTVEIRGSMPSIHCTILVFIQLMKFSTQGQHPLCSSSWNGKAQQGKTYTKDIVLLKFVQSHTCQISLKWEWRKNQFSLRTKFISFGVLHLSNFLYGEEILTRKI